MGKSVEYSGWGFKAFDENGVFGLNLNVTGFCHEQTTVGTLMARLMLCWFCLTCYFFKEKNSSEALRDEREMCTLYMQIP